MNFNTPFHRTLFSTLALSLTLLLLTACGDEPKDLIAIPTPTVPPIQDVSGGLESLQSYRLRFSLTTENRVAGQTEAQGIVEYVRDVVAAPAAQAVHWRTEVPGDESLGEEVTIYQVGDETYLYSEEARGPTCEKSEQASATLDFESLGIQFEPNDVLSTIEFASIVERNVSLQGIVTNHYSVSESTKTSTVLVETTGEAWVAKEGQFVVRYEGQQVNQVSLGGNETETIRRWVYTIEELNQLLPIELPDECEE